MVDTLDSGLMLGPIRLGICKISPKTVLQHDNHAGLGHRGAGDWRARGAGGLIGDKMALSGKFWDVIRALNGNFGSFGYAIIAFFIFYWMASIAYYRWRGYDDLVFKRS